MRHKGDLPAFSQNIIDINKKLSSLHAINFSSSGELASVILKDISLTNKLLKVVNSSLYGSISGKVTTVSRAVFLLGAERVRIAAASLMIFDHLQNKSQVGDLKDASVFSFFSAILARRLSGKMMFAATEEVFICALLHHLGKHLVICYFPEEYNEIKNVTSTKGIDEQSASRKILGVSYSELGMGIAKSWSFPQSIIDSMDIIRDPETKTPENNSGLLKSIANYASELCSVAANPDTTGQNAALQAISDKYKITVPFPVHLTMDLIKDATTDIEQYADIFKIDKSRSALLRRLSSYNEEAPPDASSRDKLTLIPSNNREIRSASKRLSADEEQLEMLKGCIMEINEMLHTEISISDAIYMIMEAMYRGFEFNRVVFCMLDQKHSRMTARFGFGENIDTILEHFRFKITRSSDLFNLAVLRQKDFVINDSKLSGIWESLPGWYLKIINVRSFSIYPLIVKDKCIGLFYADKKTPDILNGDQRDYMNILREKAIWALLNKH